MVIYFVDKTKLRLRDGTAIGDGRVEVQHNGVWGTICADNFDSNDAKTVCRNLGYGEG